MPLHFVNFEPSVCVVKKKTAKDTHTPRLVVSERVHMLRRLCGDEAPEGAGLRDKGVLPGVCVRLSVRAHVCAFERFYMRVVRRGLGCTLAGFFFLPLHAHEAAPAGT